MKAAKLSSRCFTESSEVQLTILVALLQAHLRLSALLFDACTYRNKGSVSAHPKIKDRAAMPAGHEGLAGWCPECSAQNARWGDHLQYQLLPAGRHNQQSLLN